jgi:hypothetical protein
MQESGHWKGEDLASQMKHRVSVLMGMGALAAATAMAMFVNVEFFGGVDIAAFSTYSWAEGTPPANFDVKQAIQRTTDEELAVKGYLKVDGVADFTMAIHTDRDEMFQGGTLRVEAYEGSSEELVWRGKAEGVLTTTNPNKLPRLARQATKKMFKKFPKAR